MQSYPRLWPDFARQSSLPTNNQSNLALKGIIGIAAMSKIASIFGNDNDAEQFNVGNMAQSVLWRPDLVLEHGDILHTDVASQCCDIIARQLLLWRNEYGWLDAQPLCRHVA